MLLVLKLYKSKNKVSIKVQYHYNVTKQFNDKSCLKEYCKIEIFPYNTILILKAKNFSFFLIQFQNFFSDGC